MNIVEKKYKAVIIGAGITGLSTGLALTKVFDPLSNPVLILEQHTVPGGCVATFARQGYRFDTVQIIPDVSHVLDFFGIDVNLLTYQNIYARLFLADPDSGNCKVFPVDSGNEQFAARMMNQYPDAARNIMRFFDYCQQMHSELRYLKTEPRFHQLFSILFHCPKIIFNSSKTYKQFLKKFGFSHPEIYEILDIFSSFSGLSGNRCAALLTACAMVTTLKGSYRPQKGFIQFPLLLQKAFEERGGEIIFGSSVRKILTENAVVTGVELNDGRRIEAEIVVSTADTQKTFGDMLGYDVLQNAGKKYAAKASNAQMSPSAMAIHLGLDDSIDLKSMGFDCGYNVLTTGRESHEKMFDEWEKGNILMSDSCFHFGVISPSAMTGGKQTLIIHIVPVASEKWIHLRQTDPDAYDAEKQRVSEFYIDKTEQYMIPGLKKHILFTDISTPATYARYIGSPTGANFDMMPVPENFGKNRLKVRTPVKNLFLPKFSHGIWPAMQGGLQVVDMISGGKIMKGSASYFGERNR
jgi:all-trans-retinol 13,14-reductase